MAKTSGNIGQHLAARWAAKEAFYKAWTLADAGDEIPGAQMDWSQIEVVKALFNTFESVDWSVLPGVIAPDVVVHAYGDGKEIRGLEDLRLALIKERESLEGRIEIKEIVSVGPIVGAQIFLQGELKRDSGPLKATGRVFAEHGVDIFRLKDGKITEWDNYRNWMDLMAQLGLFPPPRKK